MNLLIPAPTNFIFFEFSRYGIPDLGKDGREHGKEKE